MYHQLHFLSLYCILSYKSKQNIHEHSWTFIKYKITVISRIFIVLDLPSVVHAQGNMPCNINHITWQLYAVLIPRELSFPIQYITDKLTCCLPIWCDRWFVFFLLIDPSETSKKNTHDNKKYHGDKLCFKE
jgi:hypothetical protein